MYKVNVLKLTKILEFFAPDGVIQMRPNILAIYTSKPRLLNLAWMTPIEIHAYEPRPCDSAVSIILDIHSDITDAELKSKLHAAVTVTNARRVDRWLTARLVFNDCIRYIQYTVHPNVGELLRCSTSFSFDHVRYNCPKPSTYAQCEGKEIGKLLSKPS